MLVMLAGSSKAVRAWAIGASSAVLYAIFIALFLHYWADVDLAWAAAVPVGILAGIVLGVAMGLALPEAARPITDALAPLTYRQRREAVRATRRGPAPEDSEVRAAALTLVEERRRQREGWYRHAWALFAFALAFSLLMALLSSPWWWLGVALYLYCFVADQWLRRSMPNRIAVLGATATS